MIKRVKLAVLLMLLAVSAHAQSLTNATALYNDFVKLLSTSGESTSAYSTLYRCYEQYWGVLGLSDSDFLQAKEGLMTIFPYIYNGAYFYTGQNNQSKVVQFAEAYINISMHEAIKNENLPLKDDYATFAWMAATSNYNSKKYDKAIVYLQAYINSGEAKKRADAYLYMAKSYEHLKDIPHAQYILEQGLLLYPDNKSMLVSAINILGASKSNDAKLQQYITQMMMYKPNDEALLNIQAQLYERNHNYEQAANTYSRLRSLKPNSLEVARHLSVNYYNAGVVYAQKASQVKNVKQKKSTEYQRYRQDAERYFSQASKVLEDVLYSDPLAINYAYALANAYAYMGDTGRLQSLNSKIQTLGYTPVTASDDNMQEVAYTNMSASPNLMAPAPTPGAVASNQQPVASNPMSQSRQASQLAKTPVKKSDVDVNIPMNNTDNVNTFAVIIANEKYNKVSDVPNAENDGDVFAEYCHKVLGIPSDNIRHHKNITFGGLLDAIEDMKAIAVAKRGECNFIFYYAGHGVPDEKTKSAYLLPVDADGKQMRVCYPLSALYSDFSALNAKCVAVFMDACFSGATRTVDAESNKQEMLLSARSVEIDVDDEEIEGNVVVFSAASADQTALSYDDQNHGMFTYFLLKKLKETKGNVNLQELGKYITDEVSLKSQLKNKKSQIPTVISGFSMGDKWKSMKLK